MEEFERALRAVREPKTVEAYLLSARKFKDFLGECQITPNTMSDFVIYLSEKGLSPASIHLYKAGAAQYLSWLRVHGTSVPDQVKSMMPRIREKIITVLNDDALATYMAVTKTVHEPYRTALLLLPLTGLRVGEVCSLKLADVQVQAPWGYILVLHDTKGKSDRIVPILKSGTPILMSYLTHVRATLPGDVWLFPARGGSHIHTRSLQLFMRSIRVKAGISHMTPHTLRHIYATILERSGVNTLKLMQIMGHKNLQTTRRYVHLTAADLANDLGKVSTPWAGKEDDL